MKKNAKPAAPPATKKGKAPAAALAPSMAPAACPTCGKQPVVVSAGALSAWVCSTANCLTVGARRDSVNKALAAWNSLKPASPAPAAPAPKRSAGPRPPWEDSAAPPAPRGKAAAAPAAPPAAQAKGRGAKAAPASVAAPAGRPGGIGAFIRELIQKGHETAAILEQVRAKFPHSKATASDVSWNKGKLRKQGIAV